MPETAKAGRHRPFPASTTMSMSRSPEITVDTAAGTLTGTGATYNTLVARHSSKCADVPNQSLWQGVDVSQYTYNGGTNQLWTHGT